MQKMYIRKAVEEYTLGIAVCADALNGVNNVVDVNGDDDVNDGSKSNDNVHDSERRKRNRREKEEERRDADGSLATIQQQSVCGVEFGNNKRCIEGEKCLGLATNIKAYFRSGRKRVKLVRVRTMFEVLPREAWRWKKTLPSLNR